jgi:hypothetical protein
VIEVTQALVELAGEYAEVFALRGYDSVQLACSSQTAKMTQDMVCFASFDLRLNKAAAALGMPVFSKALHKSKIFHSILFVSSVLTMPNPSNYVTFQYGR